MRFPHRASYLTVSVLLLAGMSIGAAGEIVRLPFSGQRLYRTPSFQIDDQSGVGETVGAERLFGVFINTTLYGQITESIDTYIADLESDGWRVVLYSAEGGTSQKSESEQWTIVDFRFELQAARQLRELARNEYDQGMVGCIIIGELPAGWVEAETGSGTGTGIPVDLFFRDMDSQWDDTDGNGLLDENFPTNGDCKPEIWMSRLYANSLDGDEVSLMKNYFRKNHAYRIGELTLPKRALDYVDDDWAGAGFFLRGLYDEVTQINDDQTTTASDYLARLAEGYDLIRVSVHGYGWGHGFIKNGTRSDVFYWDIIADDPCCFFYDIYSCGTFGWWVPNYIDGWYVFSPSYGLASWGPCGYGTAGVFYDALDLGKCLGDAQLQHSNYLATGKSFLPGDEAGTFGMFGDPALVLRQSPSGPTIIYVDGDATGEGSGLDWENAYNNLQDALSAPSWGTEIRVAQGIYMPDQGAAVRPGDRSATFRLRNGVVIKGGYAGPDEPDPNARDVGLYRTILSGEIGVLRSNVDNSYHVISVSNVGAAAVLDGFTVEGGYADANYGDVNNCGGGIYLSYSSPSITDCNLVDNYAKHGGGMFSTRDCTPTISNCRLQDNSAIEGGGMANEHHSRPILDNCVFSSNQAQSTGGGIYNGDHCEPLLANCIFANNTALDRGGAIFNSWGSPRLSNCELISNSAGTGGGMYDHRGSPKLTGCVFGGNQGTGLRGYDSHAVLEHCEFYSNSGFTGGGLELDFGYMTISNCVFSGNEASWGGGIYGYGTSSLTLTNCTIACNSAKGDGGGILGGNELILFNCILWENSDDWGRTRDESAQIQASNPIINFSCVQGWTNTLGGIGNIDIDPHFADQNSGNYHLKSQAGHWDENRQGWRHDGITSPCIDTGDPNMSVGNEPEPNGGIINMGAYGGTVEASKSYRR